MQLDEGRSQLNKGHVMSMKLVTWQCHVLELLEAAERGGAGRSWLRRWSVGTDTCAGAEPRLKTYRRRCPSLKHPQATLCLHTGQ